jgi:hypothetical protein
VRRILLAWSAVAVIGVTPQAAALVSSHLQEPGNYLTWTASQARKIAGSTRENGRVGGGQGLLHTERALSYKLRATWLTDHVIRAGARLVQLSDRLTNEQTEALVTAAEAVEGTVIIVEIDPADR